MYIAVFHRVCTIVPRWDQCSPSALRRSLNAEMLCNLGNDKGYGLCSSFIQFYSSTIFPVLLSSSMLLPQERTSHSIGRLNL